MPTRDLDVDFSAAADLSKVESENGIKADFAIENPLMKGQNLRKRDVVCQGTEIFLLIDAPKAAEAVVSPAALLRLKMSGSGKNRANDGKTVRNQVKTCRFDCEVRGNLIREHDQDVICISESSDSDDAIGCISVSRKDQAKKSKRKQKRPAKNENLTRKNGENLAKSSPAIIERNTGKFGVVKNLENPANRGKVGPGRNGKDPRNVAKFPFNSDSDQRHVTSIDLIAAQESPENQHTVRTVCTIAPYVGFDFYTYLDIELLILCLWLLNYWMCRD